MFRKLSFLMAFVLALSLAMPAVATDYYLDAVSGDDDTGDGSFGSPWKTFANIMSYERSFCRPSGWVNIQAGDTIYLMNGTYDELSRSQSCNRREVPWTGNTINAVLVA
jgi:hypothetical protein